MGVGYRRPLVLAFVGGDCFTKLVQDGSLVLVGRFPARLLNPQSRFRREGVGGDDVFASEFDGHGSHLLS